MISTGVHRHAAEALLADVIGDLDDASISIPDQLEGAAVTADGRFFAATDNDGVDGNVAQTILIELDVEP